MTENGEDLKSLNDELIVGPMTSQDVLDKSVWQFVSTTY